MKERILALLIIQVVLIVGLSILLAFSMRQEMPGVVTTLLALQFVVSTDLLYLYMKDKKR